MKIGISECDKYAKMEREREDGVQPVLFTIARFAALPGKSSYNLKTHDTQCPVFVNPTDSLHLI